ncbi:MAG: hypothetical protein IPJ34_39190 [Myxococcales bacterium]|nr:hypothetical protein [Myxococcales bacterium]
MIRTLSFASLALVLVAGCSSEDGATVPGTDTGTATDTAVDTATDTGVADTGVADTTTDAPVDTTTPDVAVDGDAAGKIEATTTGTVTGNCMPVIPKDPANITGSLTIKNSTGAAIGPVTAEYGVLKSGGTAFATWKIDKIDLGTIAPGETKSQKWQKTAGTYSSDETKKDGVCDRCGTDVIVEITVFGLGTTSGTPVAAPATKIACAL